MASKTKNICCAGSATSTCTKDGHVKIVGPRLCLGTEAAFDDVIKAVRTRKCIVWIGAGFSVPAKFPKFRDILQEVAERADLQAKAAATTHPSRSHNSFVSGAMKVLKCWQNKWRGGSLDALQFALERHLSKETMSSILGEILTTPDPLPVAMEEQLDLLCRIPWAAVLTTNWDRLLEKKYRQVPRNESGAREIAASQAKPVQIHGITPLLKTQGSPWMPGEFLLSKSDYESPQGTRFNIEALGKAIVSQRHPLVILGSNIGREGKGWRSELLDMITRSPQFIPVFFVTHDITASKRQLMKKRWKNMTIINFCSTATNWGGNRLFLQALDSHIAQSITV